MKILNYPTTLNARKQTTLSLPAIILTPFFFFCFSLNSYAQSGRGSSRDLDTKNGYKTIQLGADISTLKKDKLSSLDDGKKISADSILRYEYLDTALYKVSDDLRLLDIGIDTYRGKILTIKLIFNQSKGMDLYFLYYKAYGYSSQSNRFINRYEWNSSKVGLFLDFEKSGFASAIYTCKPLKAEIDERKANSFKKAAADL